MTLASSLAIIGIGGFELLLIPLVFAVVVGLTMFWIWMLVDCAKRISAGDTRQVGWLIAIALAHLFGALAYYLFGRGVRPAAQS